MRKYLNPLYEKILSYLIIEGEKRLVDIARQVGVKRQTLLYHLRKLCRRKYLERINKGRTIVYRANIEKFLQYVISMYGPMNISQLARKLFTFMELKEQIMTADLRRIKEKIRRHLYRMVSQGSLVMDDSGKYRVVSLDDIVISVLDNLGLPWRRINMHGIDFINVQLKSNTLLIKTYEGLYRRDIEYLLRLSTDYVEKIFISDKPSTEMYPQIIRILQTLTLIMNEKLGLLNIISFAKSHKEKILVVIRGYDISRIEPTLILEANRKINMIAKRLESLKIRSNRELFTLINTYYLRDSIKRLKTVIEEAHSLPNTTMIFGLSIEELKEKIRKKSAPQ